MKRFFSILAVLLSLAVVLTACGGGGGGGGGGDTGGGGGGSTTNVSGKVTLSGTAAGSPSAKASYLKAMAAMSKGRPGSKSFRSSKTAPSTVLSKTLNAAAADIPLTDAWVYLFNADHPEWLYPVSSTTTDSVDGTYTLTTLKNAAQNGNAYTNGDSIPAGNYTFLAWKSTPGSAKIIAVVQAVTTKLTGAVTIDLKDAVTSTKNPKVVTMFGLPKNTDGTQTWGSAATTVPGNSAIQVTFDMPMWRQNLNSGITISPAVSGHWSLSADWLTATFYPDQGSSFAAGTLYTITVNGSGSANPVTNVFGNSLAANAVGTFTAAAADSANPTAIVVSPTTSSAVDILTPIRIASNKLLDVNTLTLVGTPSLGAKPGILYIGEDASLGQYKYVYEFVLANPLVLNTTYDITISGGKGVNGKTMNNVTYSFSTATTGSGIDSGASTDTQNAQAAVADVFGKWVRSMNDRNSAQFASLMSPEFYMEYDTSKGISSTDDVNRDGRFSFTEFTNMISNAFTQWTYCGTTMAGTIIGTINVVGDTADFEFTLTATSTVMSTQCADAGPKASLYTTLQNKNGAWVMVRASEGIDTRTRPITYPSVLTATLYDSAASANVPDGGQLSGVPMGSSNVATWSWPADANVKGSYVALIIDQRDPRHGVAIALPSSATDISTGTDPTSAGVGGKDVSNKFGFNNSMQNFNFVAGGLYYYEVIGLGSIGVTEIKDKADNILLADVVSLSKLNSFSIAGVYKVLSVAVYPGATATGTPLTYSDMIGGYDAGSGNQVTIQVTTPNTTTVSGMLNVNGTGYQQYPLSFTAGVATVTVNLYQGWSYIWIDDGSGTGGTAGGPGTSGLTANLNVKTTGGIPPVIKVTSVVDDVNATPITGDAWNYYTAHTGATKVTVSGTVSDTTIGQLYVNLNNEGGAYGNSSILVTAPTTTGAPSTFSVTLDIYQGNNWINVSGNTTTGTGPGMMTSANLGVYTDTGSIWVPPFSNLNVAGATKTGDWGSSSDWDGSSAPNNTVTITGKLKFPANATYNVWSDGSSAYGNLNALADGTFSLDVTLYSGWNYVSFMDSANDWYGINIYTTTGKPVIKTVISTINGNAYDGSSYNVTVNSCSVDLVGTAAVGNLQVNWSGSNGTNYYSDQQNVTVNGTAGSSGSFTVSIPILGGAGSYNYIDLYDANMKWTGIYVTTTATTCTYTPLAITVDVVSDSTGSVLSIDPSYGYYNAFASSTVTVSGTSTRPGRSVNVDVSLCGSPVRYTTTSSASPNAGSTYDWSISGVTVYNNVNAWESNSINVSSGNAMSQWFNVHASNGNTPPPPPIQITGVTNATYNASSSSCNNSYYDASSANPSTVTITGTTTSPDGTGTYNDATGGSHQFTITGGSFTIGPLDVYDQYNYFYIYDTKYNYSSVTVYTTNLRAKPQFVTITSPAVNTTNLAGLQTVSGTIQDPTASGYAPTTVYGYAYVGVYDALSGMCNYSNVNFSSDPYDQVNYQDKPISFDPAAMTFTFTVDFGTGPGTDTYGYNICYSYIDVHAYDNMLYVSHDYTTYVNNSWNATPYWYKPGVKKTASDPKIEAARTADMKALQQRIMP